MAAAATRATRGSGGVGTVDVFEPGAAAGASIYCSQSGDQAVFFYKKNQFHRCNDTYDRVHVPKFRYDVVRYVISRSTCIVSYGAYVDRYTWASLGKRLRWPQEQLQLQLQHLSRLIPTHGWATTSSTTSLLASSSPSSRTRLFCCAISSDAATNVGARQFGCFLPAWLEQLLGLQKKLAMLWGSGHSAPVQHPDEILLPMQPALHLLL
eukprot:SAG31_NODE_1788_length_7267_cov_6.640067_6_plen_209_part_00